MKTIVVKHPLVRHKLSILRDKNTGTKEFREIAGEIATILCYEATREATLMEVIVETPMMTTKEMRLDENQYAFIPILRAGLSMVDGVLNMIPNAKIGHIGMYRNESTFEPVPYYFKVPHDVESREVILLDPMLATGGSAADAITQVKKCNVKKIKVLCIIAAPEGLERIEREHPDVQVYCASIDRCLNKKGYIVPGLGDAGDRIFGTK